MPQQLATAKGDILENKALLESLNQTKVKASSIEKALQESIVLQESLNKVCGFVLLTFSTKASEMDFWCIILTFR